MSQIAIRDAGPVISLAWHPTDDRLAIATSDEHVLVWSASDATVTSRTTTTAPLSSLAWSPEGNELAFGGQDETITIWNPANDASRVLVDKAESPLEMQLSWSSTGVLASVGGDRQIKMWDLSADTISRQFDGYELATEIAWSPDGTLLACANYDDAVLVWDPETEEMVASFEAYEVAPSSVAWSPDGGRLAVAGISLVVWDLSADSQSVLSEPLEPPPSVAWSPDGALLATAEYEQTRVWDLATGTAIQTFPGFGSDAQTVGWSADGAKMAFAGMSAPHIWNRDSAVPTPLAGHLSEMTALALSPDGRRVVFADDDNVVRVWTLRSSPDDDTNTSESVISRTWVPTEVDDRNASPGESPYRAMLLHQRKLGLPGIPTQLRALAWSPGCSLFASAGQESIVRIWDPDTVETNRTLSHSSAWSLCWSPDGTMLATAGAGGRIMVWSSAGLFADALTDDLFTVSLAWAPDGDRLVSVGPEGAIRVWTVTENRGQGWKRLFRRPELTLTLALDGDDNHEADMVAWSPDGTRFATLDQRRHSVRIWGAVTGKGREFDSSEWAHCISIAWLASGVELAGVSNWGTAFVWNLESNSRTAFSLYTGLRARIWAVSWSDDRSRVATIDTDHTIGVWDPTTGLEIDRFPRPS